MSRSTWTKAESEPDLNLHQRDCTALTSPRPARVKPGSPQKHFRCPVVREFLLATCFMPSPVSIGQQWVSRASIPFSMGHVVPRNLVVGWSGVLALTQSMWAQFAEPGPFSPQSQRFFTAHPACQLERSLAVNPRDVELCVACCPCAGLSDRMYLLISFR